MNEHYDIDKDPNSTVNERNGCLLQILKDEWNGFLKYSDEVSDHLLAVFKERR